MSSIRTIQTRSGKTLRLGRNPSLVPQRATRLARYLRPELPPPPAAVPVPENAIWPMYENDQLGDCVIACMLHEIGLVTLRATGNEVLFTDDDATRFYSAIGGYVPGDSSTDNGCIIADMLNYLVAPGADGHTLLGWAVVDGTNPIEIQQAIQLFGSLVIGFGVPDEWLQSFVGDGSDVWDVGPGVSVDPANGHCVLFIGYDASGVYAVTWGAVVRITWPAVAMILDPSVGGESETGIASDWATSTKPAPNGIALAELIADLQAFGPVTPPLPAPPSPSPLPPAPPSPTPSPTPAPVTMSGSLSFTLNGASISAPASFTPTASNSMKGDLASLRRNHATPAKLSPSEIIALILKYGPMIAQLVEEIISDVNGGNQTAA